MYQMCRRIQVYQIGFVGDWAAATGSQDGMKMGSKALASMPARAACGLRVGVGAHWQLLQANQVSVCGGLQRKDTSDGLAHLTL